MTIAQTFPNGLRVPQIVGALRIFEERRLLLADQPGAGKTAQALVGLELDGAFDRAGYATLILCNTTGCQLTWAGELRERVASQYDVVIADLTDTRGRKTMPSLAQREQALRAAWVRSIDEGKPLIVLANFESIRWVWRKEPKLRTVFEIQFSAVLIDEGHLVLPTKEDAHSKLTQFWHGLVNLKTHGNAIRVSLTGTPDRGKLQNRYGHWKFLWPGQYNDFWAWARSTFIVTQNSWGGVEFGKRRSETVWEEYDRRHMLRRTKQEMLEGLVDKFWAGRAGAVELPLTEVQRTAYEDFQRELAERISELIADDKANEAEGLRLQFALRGRQMATCTWTLTETIDDKGVKHTTAEPIVAGPEASSKLAWTLQWLDERGYLPDGFDASQGKVVIVSSFTKVLGWMKAELAAVGVHAEILSGDTPGPQKQAVEAAFQRGDLRVVLLSMGLGVSINLDAADDMIFLDCSHDPDKMEQVEDRIHRASRMHQVTYWRLIALDTVDEAVLEIVDARYRETRKTYDGVRGVNFARTMIPKSYFAQQKAAA